MDKNVVETIKDAEVKASKIISDANEQVRSIMRSAEDDMQIYSENEILNARDDAKKMISKAEELANIKAEQLMNDNINQANNLKLKSKKNIEDAVNLIINSIISD